MTDTWRGERLERLYEAAGELLYSGSLGVIKPRMEMLRQAYVAVEQAAPEPSAGFCEVHKPTPSKYYSACWVCSRIEESIALADARAAIREAVQLLDTAFGITVPHTAWLALPAVQAARGEETKE